MSRVTVEAFGPRRPWVRPGGTVRAGVVLSAATSVPVQLHLAALDLATQVARVEEVVEVGPGSSRHQLELELPDAGRRGYGLRLEVDDGSSLIEVTSAVEAIDGWWESPRHAAITEYADEDAASKATGDLVDWHVNVIQHYDWMWRHYRYRPPDGRIVFEDALGRIVSHDAVRASIETGREHGIASLAYGSVYGAETEYVDEHPEECVFGEDGEPLSLGGTFHINDLRPGSPWRSRLLGEYEGVVRDFGFDGIHMDTYGPPHTAVAVDGEPIDFALLYPGLITDAAACLSAAVPGSRVLFNCVEGFPLEAVAMAPTSCLYLELWPPDRTLADVVRWVDRARALAAGRQVVIAAYAATLKGPAAVSDRAAAFEAVVLLGSVIAAAGAYHHTLAEGDRLLVEGYYPAAVAMLPAEVAELRALWRFSARYLHLLTGSTLPNPGLRDLEITTRDGHPVPWTTVPASGALWVRATVTSDGRIVLHLIDLRGQDHSDWDAPMKPAPLVADVLIAGSGIGTPVAASPWSRSGDAMLAEASGDGWRLPPFRRWLMVTDATPRR